MQSLVFGEGPQQTGLEISLHSIERCVAAELFKQGRASFVILRGVTRAAFCPGFGLLPPHAEPIFSPDCLHLFSFPAPRRVLPAMPSRSLFCPMDDRRLKGT